MASRTKSFATVPKYHASNNLPSRWKMNWQNFGSADTIMDSPRTLVLNIFPYLLDQIFDKSEADRNSAV